jgi:hypothetical protein
MISEADYWNVKYHEALVDRESADVRFVNSFNPVFSKDGDHFCLMIGANPMEGIAVFDKKVSLLYEKMNLAIRGVQ